MIRFTLLQARLQIVMTLAGLVAVAAILLLTRQGLADVLAHCRTIDACNPFVEAPGALVYAKLRMLLGVLIVTTPALLGMFWGAPLVSRELENATYRLVWTQSVTRMRWLATKIGVLGSVAIFVTGAMSWMVGAWAHKLDATAAAQFSSFDQRDVVPVAHAAFAFVIGVSIGFFLRRVVPAMVVTMIVYAVTVAGFAHDVRPHLLTPRERAEHISVATVRAYMNEGTADHWVALSPSIPNAMVVKAGRKRKHLAA